MTLATIFCEMCGIEFAGYNAAKRKTCSITCKSELIRQRNAWTASRIMALIDIGDNGCWLTPISMVREDGYGTFGGKHLAHRLAWTLFVEPIPLDLQLDHLCRVRRCCNPAHLEPVTLRENLIRGEGFTGRRSRQTACIHNHEFTPENTMIRKNGTRQCRTCDRERARLYAHRSRRARTTAQAKLGL